MYNYYIINKKDKDIFETKNDISKLDKETKLPYDKILNNLIIFLYKKLTPVLFQEVKDYLSVQYMKYKNKSFNGINNES